MTWTMRRLGALAALGALLWSGMAATATADSLCTAANECGTYRLADIKEYWDGSTPPDTPVTIDDTKFDALGGYIAFTVRNSDPNPQCTGQVQRFKFSWVFTPEVSIVTGKSGTTLAIMRTVWEGDTGGTCVNENPFVWIRSGGRYGPNEVDQVNGDTFKMSFANEGGENRIYFNGGGAGMATVGMNWPLYPTGGVSIQPEIKYFGHPMSIVYAYERMPDSQAAAAAKAATVTAVPISQRTMMRIDVNPNLGAGYWTFQIQRRNADGTWTTLARVYRTQGADETRTLDLGKGTYRIVIVPRDGYGAATSPAVRLVG